MTFTMKVVVLVYVYTENYMDIKPLFKIIIALFNTTL